MALKKPRSLPASRRPLPAKPLQTSSPAGSTRSHASRALSGMQPARQQHRNADALTDPPADGPVVHAARAAQLLDRERGLPESSSSVSTSGAAARASSTDSGPDTWITCTSRTPGSSLRRRRSSISSSGPRAARQSCRSGDADRRSLRRRQTRSAGRSRSAPARRRRCGDVASSNRPGTARHCGHEPDRGSARLDGEPRLVQIRNAAHLHEHQSLTRYFQTVSSSCFEVRAVF